MDPAWFAPLVLVMPELASYFQQISHIHDTYIEGPSGLMFEITASSVESVDTKKSFAAVFG